MASKSSPQKPRAQASRSKPGSLAQRLTKPSAKQLASLKPPKHWSHQLVTKALLKKVPRVLDASDPGTGKTRAALEAFADRRRAKGKCLLVVAPKSLLKTAWADDAKKYTPELVCSIAYAENREQAFAADADVYIINTDGVKWLAKQPRAFFARFDSLVVDELSYFKHRTSARSKAMAKIRGYFRYREGLTGTPNSTTITDIWHQLFILDDGERLGKSFFAFRESTCSPQQVGPKASHIKWTDKLGAEEAVSSLISDITVRHKFEECMDIPPNHTYSVSYTLPKKLMTQYVELAERAILELQQDGVTAINAAVLRTKLLQVASGAVYADSSVQVLDTGRYELVMDLIEERQHSVTFFLWTHQKEQLAKMADSRGISYEIIDGTVPVARREEIVDAYQAGFYQTLFMHPKTGAHGLTLTRGTATIWPSPIYEPDILKQGLHRVYRGGQKKATETILVEAEGTIEGAVYKMLMDKNARMVNLLDLLES